jgi:hypothetical protein
LRGTAIDAGPLIALFDSGDDAHADAMQFARQATGRLITNMVVIGEVAAMLAFSDQAQTDFLSWFRSRLEIDRETDGDMARVVEIMRKYRDLPADFAGATLLALCERRGIEQVATLDSDFDVLRTRTGKTVRNVFFKR